MGESGKKLAELTELVSTKKEEAFQEVIAEHKDYVLMHHLSAARANLISWLPINKSQHVLEVHAECGACTGALAELAGAVTALSDTEEEAQVNRLRNKERTNINYRIGGIKALSLKEQASYDWIIADTDSLTQLKELRQYLAPDGRLVLAASNCFGIRRWAGVGEEPGEVSRNELTGALAEAGFTEWEYYYPYPDREFPMMLYSDEWLPRKGELRHNLRNFKEPRYEHFSEQQAFDCVIEKGMFREYANAYLIVTGAAMEQERAIYIKYSDERARRFMVRTDIVRNKTERYVRKQALVPEGEAHLQHIQKSGECLKKRYQGSILHINACRSRGRQLEFEYLEGMTLSDKLNEETSAGQAETLLEKYRSLVAYGCQVQPFEMSEGFRQVFGETELPGQLPAASGLDIDMIFSNIILQKDAWQLIDYEWTFDFPIPVNYVLYRAYFYESLEHPENEAVSVAALKRLGILSEEEEAAYAKMEKAFLAYTLQGTVPTRDMWQLLGQPVWKLSTLEDKIRELNGQIEGLKGELIRTRTELSMIKGSRTWRLHEWLRRRKK